MPQAWRDLSVYTYAACRWLPGRTLWDPHCLHAAAYGWHAVGAPLTATHAWRRCRCTTPRATLKRWSMSWIRSTTHLLPNALAIPPRLGDRTLGVQAWNVRFDFVIQR
jgi:hypothetical protein